MSAPILGKPAIIRVDLVTAGAWVDILTNPPKEAFAANPENPNNSSIFLQTIKDWNFVLDDGTKAPITAENIDKGLSNFDLMKISKALGIADVVLSEIKKNN